MLAIRVIDCLDALSGCIISLWLRPRLGSDPGSEVIEKQEGSGVGESEPNL